MGDSLAVPLPAAVVDALDLKEGDQIEVRIAGPREFEISRDRSREAAIERLLRFAIPNHPRIQKFDEITVIVFPDSERARTGAKIAITQFELLPP